MLCSVDLVIFSIIKFFSYEGPDTLEFGKRLVDGALEVLVCRTRHAGVHFREVDVFAIVFSLAHDFKATSEIIFIELLFLLTVIAVSREKPVLEFDIFD